ncbi:hypothetical protein [Pseudoduganella namucuonensis]|uniref:hypothetical protein n=1 Tax=Pseudoduganella namucuonensis TaxID=1035707 RepID=UPI0011603730|nr:hypothetical protein [Pseudoduganella namucuonensis]
MITMRAADRDGNTASAMATIRMAGAAPGLRLQVTPLDTLPTTSAGARAARRALSTPRGAKTWPAMQLLATICLSHFAFRRGLPQICTSLSCGG